MGTSKIEHWENFSMGNLEENIDGVLYKEDWRPVPIDLYSTSYMVSSFGRIKSVKRNMIIRQSVVAGYLQVTLCCKGKSKSILGHILTAKAWIPNPENLPQVNHKKGIKTDNRIWELEWSTSSHNIKHSFKMGLSKKGEEHGISKLTNKQVLDIFHSKEKRSCIMEKYCISLTTVKSIKLGKTWSEITGKIYEKSKNKTHAGLSDQNVIDIFESTERPSVLMEKYKISNVSINRIKTSKNWGYLTKGHIKGEWR